MKSKPIYKITRRQSSALYYPDQQLKQNVLPRGARFYHVGQECRLQELENMKPDHVCFHALITQCLPTLELFTNTTHPHFLLPTLAIYQKLLLYFHSISELAQTLLNVLLNIAMADEEYMIDVLQGYI